MNNNVFGPKRLLLGTYSPEEPSLKKRRKALLNAFVVAQFRTKGTSPPAVFFKKARRSGALSKDVDWLEQRFKKAVADFMNVNTKVLQSIRRLNRRS
jgi:hypothetical protein